MYRNRRTKKPKKSATEKGLFWVKKVFPTIYEKAVQHVQQFQQNQKYTYISYKGTFLLIESPNLVGTCRTVLERVAQLGSVPTVLEHTKRQKTANGASRGRFWVLLELLDTLDTKLVS